MRAPALVGIITALHIFAITAFVLIQGCGTTRPTLRSSQSVEQPPPPVMPSRAGGVPPAFSSAAPAPAPSAPAITSPAEAGNHSVQKGETLSQVAKMYGVTTRELVELNHLANPNSLKIGQVILIPPHASAPVRTTAPTAPAATPRAPGPGGSYVVMAGDTLSGIAKKNGVRVAELKRANGLTSDLILVGQKLILPGEGAARASTPTAPRSASPPPSVSADDEMAAGGLMDESPSTGITDIAVPESPPATDSPSIPATNMTPQNKPIPYTVVAGDTLDEIAKLFIVSKAEIMELNGLGPNDTLTPGQKIKIPPSDL